jgi:hypothetical protein
MELNNQMFFALASVALLTGCTGGGEAPPQGPPFKPVASVGEVMHDIVLPNAEAVWDSVGTIFTLEETEEIAPATEDEWVAVRSSATTLMEAGNLLMMDGRAKDDGPWMVRAQALIDAGASVREAAEARDAPLVFERGELIFNACQGCHFEYRFEEDPETIRSH